jgi:hypothetical protein
MPKRIVDGEGLWRSEKLRSVEEWARSEYANLIPLAAANGVFECTPDRVWSLVYSYNRRSVTVEEVAEILKELESCGLLFRWKQERKTWAYFVGIEKPGRLPGISRQGKHEAVGPEPPRRELDEYKEKTREERGMIYFALAETTQMIKIGFSRSPHRRLKIHQESSPDKLSIIGIMLGNYAAEGEIHRKFKHLRSHGEWFRVEEDLTEFIENNKVKEPEEVTECFGIQNIPCLGFGTGFGIGTGLGTGTPEKQEAADAAVCFSPENLLAIYDQKRGSLPGVRELSPQRLSKCRQRLLNHKVETQKYLADFEQSVEHASRIGWPTWTPTFDWFIVNDTNYLKVLEGNYDKWALAERTAQPADPGSREYQENMRASYSADDLAYYEKFFREHPELKPANWDAEARK